MAMDWNALTTFKVHETGSPQYRDVSLANNLKTKRNLDAQIQAVFAEKNPVAAIIREDRSRVDSDLSVVFLAQGAVLEVSFANKFYWVVGDEHRRQWAQEFRSHVSFESKMSGDQARNIFTQTSVSVADLASIWELADMDKDNKLNIVEYVVAKFLIWARVEGQPIPPVLPSSLVPSIGPSPQLQPNGAGYSVPRRKSKTELEVPPAPHSAAESPKRSPRSAQIIADRHSIDPLSPVPESPLSISHGPNGPNYGDLASPTKFEDVSLPSAAFSLWSISKNAWNAYSKMFNEKNIDGFLTGGTALELFSRSGLDRSHLAKVWNLSDLDKDNQLNETEFMIAMHLIMLSMKGYDLPLVTPIELIHNIENGNRVSPSKKKIRPPPVRHQRQSSLPSNQQSLTISPSISPLSPPKFPHHGASPSGAPGAATPAIAINGVSPVVPPPHVSPNQPPSPSNPPTLVGPFDVQQHQFQPFLPPAQQAFDIGPFNVPKAQGGQNDIIQGIAANIRAHVPQQRPAVAAAQPMVPSPHMANHLPQHTPSDLVAGAERSLIGVFKFDPSQVHRETLLGGGTFASVWKGKVNSEIVAIKDMSFRSEKEIEMWKREVQLLSHLQNYNYLVKIKGYLVSNDHLSIVMEFMDGGSLFDVIHKKGNVQWSMLQKARILRHIAKGIDSIHREGIVHRDLKSMNVLLDSKGIAKIADLGCSRFLREETMTIGIGSPLWMSPEVQKGGAYNYSADVFSYGVICYEVFNERLPDYDTEARMVVIPHDCVGFAIIRECIHKNANRRPSASQLIESMDLLISSFTMTVARVVLANFKGDPKELPRADDVSGWYNVLLAYDRQTFDILLSSGA